MKGYEVEEQGLRVMLDEAVVERTKSEISQDKQILTEWKTLLFGKREAYSSFYRAAEQDVDAFIAIRYILENVTINMRQDTKELCVCTVSANKIFSHFFITHCYQVDPYNEIVKPKADTFQKMFIYCLTCFSITAILKYHGSRP